MKIKTVIRISAFMAMPFINADINSDRKACQYYLENRLCLANDRTIVAMANFDHLYSISNEDLKIMKLSCSTDINLLINWILENRPTSAVQPVSTQEEANASPSLVDMLMSLQETYSLQGNKAFEQILALAIAQNLEGLPELLKEFVETWGLQEDPNAQKAYEIACSFSADSAEASSGAPAFASALVQPSNPFLGKTAEELLAMLEVNPELNNEPLFTEALNKALGGEIPQPIPSDIESLSKAFPLEAVLQGPCDIDELKSSFEKLSSRNSENDHATFVSDGWLRRFGLVTILTPGFGNCAFDAVVLTWFCKNGLYKPQWNTTLGAYLESQIAWFREEIAKLVANNEALRDIIRTKDQYVSDVVFALMSQYLKTEIIVISADMTAQCCLLNGETLVSITSEETGNLIKDHPDALIICHNGEQHFLATRPLLPEEQ